MGTADNLVGLFEPNAGRRGQGGEQKKDKKSTGERVQCAKRVLGTPIRGRNMGRRGRAQKPRWGEMGKKIKGSNSRNHKKFVRVKTPSVVGGGGKEPSK